MELYLLVCLLAVVITLSLILLLRKNHPDQTVVIAALEKANLQLLEQNRELLNRLQAPDARTFQALQNYSNQVVIHDYQSKDDVTEAMQLRRMQTEPRDEFLDEVDSLAYHVDDFALNRIPFSRSDADDVP